jgi:23S rRNA pseudouridine1911/1915/1917 synthase
MNDAPRDADKTADAQVMEFEVEANSTVRLDAFVAAATSLSRTHSATLIATGCVLVGDRREKASYRPTGGERVHVNVPRVERRVVSGEQIPLSVLWEDDELLVVDKPAGMVVHPAPGNWSGTLVNALIWRGGTLADGQTKERAGLVHRLDRETSGLLLVAKTDRALRVLANALAARRILRRYALLSWGNMDDDVFSVDRPLARHPRDRQRMAVVEGGKTAKTTFTRIARLDGVDLLRAALHTGRTHQIRVHMNAIGHPVVGDDTYGGGGGRRLVKLPPKRHALHAAWLRFMHPTTGAPIDVRAPLPEDMRIAVRELAHDDRLTPDLDPLELYGFFDEAPTI